MSAQRFFCTFQPCLRLSARLFSLVLAAGAFALACMLAACMPKGAASGADYRHPAGSSASSALPRVDPGYLQWLERQSMLGATQNLTSQVSGTDLIWRNSASARRVPLLLSAAPNWFDVNPHSIAAGQPSLKALGQSGPVEFMTQAGFTGLFLAPTGEKGDIWSANAARTPVPESQSQNGENVTALHVDPALGSEGDFSKLTQKLDQAHIQMGGELPPAATGLGPDFILQARRASRFDGLYAMMSVPQKDWGVLPSSSGEWDCRPLGGQAVETLRGLGLIPDALRRDSLDWATPGGWAATGEVRGADGQIRRWVYRYNGNVLRPVLLWQDPSGQTRRIYSAAVIRHTGLQQQTLAGMRMEPLMGLDAQPEKHPATAPANADSSVLVPGLEALDSLAGEIHRYGGWAMQDDILPPSLTRMVLDTAVDFTRDSITPAAAAYALLSGDAAPLTALLRASLAAGVDHSRLARGLRDRQYIDWRPLLDAPGGQDIVQRAQLLAKGPQGGTGLPSTQAALAATALGLDAKNAVRPENAQAMHSACLLLLSWRVGLPGLTFMSPQDLTGALNLPDGKTGSVPLWAEGNRPGDRQPAPLAFGPLESQWAQEKSFARQIAGLLQARRAAGLAGGRLVQVYSGPAGCIATLSALPGGGYWLLAANFSDRKQKFSCNLPADATRGARDVLGSRPVSATGRSLEIELDARQARHVLLGESKTHEGAMP